MQATDQYVGTLGARIVLIDDKEVRAAMTGSWLRQMGWKDVFVLAEAGSEKGPPKPATLDSEVQSGAAIDCAALDALLSSDYAPVQGFVLLMASIFVVVNLLVDVLYGIADPRVSI